MKKLLTLITLFALTTGVSLFAPSISFRMPFSGAPITISAPAKAPTAYAVPALTPAEMTAAKAAGIGVVIAAEPVVAMPGAPAIAGGKAVGLEVAPAATATMGTAMKTIGAETAMKTIGAEIAAEAGAAAAAKAPTLPPVHRLDI